MATVTAPAGPTQRRGFARFARRNPTIVVGGVLLGFMALVALFAPWIAGDPLAITPANRLQAPSAEHWFGTDHLGRDIFARTVYGTRISLLVGLSVAVVAVGMGLVIGLLAGYYRKLDSAIMRVMDGLMAIPAILLAIALVALTKAGIGIVIVAIMIPEVPRVVRLVRSVVLSAREQPYVEAGVAAASSGLKILVRHILPNTVAPLIVQATYICASAILVESALSFLGAGVPPEIPTWGNMIASSRLYLPIAPWTVLVPGVSLALVVLAINLMGDGLRDRLDPRLARRM
ncbi:MAG: ABC transporter permease [Pseudomonadota bacterium]